MIKKYRIRDLDFGHSDTLKSFFELLYKYSATLASFEPSGPAGGNPRVAIDFPARETASDFLTEYLPSEAERELYPITCVAGSLDEILADVEAENESARS